MTDESIISVRGIPGLHEQPGRRYLYIGVDSKASMKKFLRRTDDESPNIPWPKSGGMHTENIIITTPDGRSFCGVSFKGDLDGWDAFLRGHAKRLGIGVAVIDRDKGEIVYDGGSASLVGCVIKYY